MTTITIINGIIIKDGKAVMPRECNLGLRVENVLEYLCKNRIDMTLSGYQGLVSVSVSNHAGKQKLIKALIDDNVVKASQLLQLA